MARFAISCMILMHLDYTPITPYIFLGEEYTISNYTTLQNIGVQHILDVRLYAQVEIDVITKISDFASYQNVPLQDGMPLDKPVIEQCQEIIAQSVRKKEKLYLHCQRGISRSPAILMCYFLSQKQSAETAHNNIKSKRSKIWINPNMLNSICEYQQYLYATNLTQSFDYQYYDKIRNNSFKKLSLFLERISRDKIHLAFHEIHIENNQINIDSLMACLQKRYEFRTWVIPQFIEQSLIHFPIPHLIWKNRALLWIE